MSFGQTRPKWRYLAIMDKKPNTSYQHKDLIAVHHADGGGMDVLGLFCSYRTKGSHELLCILKYSRVK